MAELSPAWQAYCAECTARAPRIRAYMIELDALCKEVLMSMDNAPENNLPPPTAAHPDPAAGTGLRLSGDWTRERDALRASYAACERQVAELTDHNTELLGVLETVRTWCLANQQAARNRAAQTGDDDWRVRQRVISEVWELVKPVQ